MGRNNKYIQVMSLILWIGIALAVILRLIAWLIEVVFSVKIMQ